LVIHPRKHPGLDSRLDQLPNGQDGIAGIG
jgi:hypothetical protein